MAEQRIVYLYLDALYPKVRSGGKVVSLPVLVALAVRESGEKVLLALATGGAETAAAWQMLMEDLAARQLGRPRLIISDGSPGAEERAGAYLARGRPSTLYRAQAAEPARQSPEHAQDAVHEDYNRIVYASTQALAERARESFPAKCRKLCPSVAASLDEAGKELLTFYRFPVSQHKSLRTTNLTERLQEEFRRRVKTQASLPSEKAASLVFFGLFASGQVKMHRIQGWYYLDEAPAVAA